MYASNISNVKRLAIDYGHITMKTSNPIYQVENRWPWLVLGSEMVKSYRSSMQIFNL